MKTQIHLRRSGFSFLEMLIVLTIIGTMVSIVAPVISSITGQSREATVRANARHPADTAMMAITAGNSDLLAAASKDDAINLLRGGVFGDGDFAANHFQVALRPDDAKEAKALLNFANGILTYQER